MGGVRVAEEWAANELSVSRGHRADREFDVGGSGMLRCLGAVVSARVSIAGFRILARIARRQEVDAVDQISPRVSRRSDSRG